MKFEKVIVERQNKAIYKDGNLAIKVFDENYSKSDILNEALNHARVEETGLNIPKIEEVSKIDGKWAISIDFIEGKTLQELMGYTAISSTQIYEDINRNRIKEIYKTVHPRA